jgi:tRNA dimethylallyltransferase
MQLYRGMDIGTAKLSIAQRQGIAHHVLDLWEVTEPASVALYQQHARRAIDEVRERGRTALIVGGSGLYLRAVLERFEFPATDAALRARLEEELAQVGASELHTRLAEKDPQAAARILPGNGRRIVRALEVVELTGQPFASALPEPSPYYECVLIGLDWPAAVLDQRVASRVERMWADGLVDEVRSLELRGLRRGRTASRALGYQQILRHLDTAHAAGADTYAGDETNEIAKAETVAATRRFVRRQRSWFRRDPRIVWLDVARPDLAGQALAVLAG